MSSFKIGDSRRRFTWLMVIVLVCFAVVVGALVWYQIIQGENLAKRTENQMTGTNISYSPRGAIVDCNGEELAVSIMAKSLYVDPLKLPAKDKQGKDLKRIAAKELSGILKINESKLYTKFSAKGRFVWVKRYLEPEVVEQIKEVIKKNKIDGLYFLEESKRYYTKNTMASQILGFVGTDDIGRAGLEYQLDAVIKGAQIKEAQTVDAYGKSRGKGSSSKAGSQDMPTVYLTLDSKIQFVLEEALDNAIKNTKAVAATAILMDPNTGAILGMASRPTFDPNKYYRYNPSTWRNRAISSIYEPGSVYKPLVVGMGLTEGLITPDTVIHDSGQIKVADRIIRNWDKKSNGDVSFNDIITHSINTGMVTLGMELGAKRMTYYSQRFGFGSPTGIGLPGEEKGILYEAEKMYEPDVATMAIGQGIAVTPLQMLRAICAIANDGYVLQPYIVDKIVLPDGKVLQQGERKVIRRVLTEENARKLRNMMRNVVEKGGGQPAQIPGYDIAGKTGTAEKLSDKGGYAKGEYMASFVGFIPAEQPKYAMLVMLDTPQGAFYGSQVAAPVFKDTLQQILVAKGIQPTKKEQLPSVAVKEKKEETKSRAKVPVLEFAEKGKVKVPDFTGLNMRQTAELIQRGNLVLVPHGSGKAKKQSVKEGVIVAEGTKIEVWFE